VKDRGSLGKKTLSSPYTEDSHILEAMLRDYLEIEASSKLRPLRRMTVADVLPKLANFSIKE
jgi:hypothetical protein